MRPFGRENHSFPVAKTTGEVDRAEERETEGAANAVQNPAPSTTGSSAGGPPPPQTGEESRYGPGLMLRVKARRESFLVSWPKIMWSPFTSRWT
jgi:hypothetical protein